MASLPPFAPRLDGPPPSPAQGAGGPSGVLPPGATSLPGSLTGLTPEQVTGQDQALRGIIQVLQSVDRILLSAITALPVASKELSMARQLIEAGLAKALTGPSPVSASPTETGTQFPGGGFSSIGPLR